MGKNKERKTTEKKSIFNSFAVRVGLIVSLVLLVVLGAKAVFDNNYEKETAIQNVETTKLEEAKKMAYKIESQFAGAYQIGYDVKSITEAMLNDVPLENRSRSMIVGSAKQMLAFTLLRTDLMVRMLKMAVFQSISNVRMARSSPLMRMELTIKNGIVLHYQEISLFF